VHSRADLSRTQDVIALFLTAFPTNVGARLFCVADSRSEEYPRLEAAQAGAELTKHIRKVE